MTTHRKGAVEGGANKQKSLQSKRLRWPESSAATGNAFGDSVGSADLAGPSTAFVIKDEVLEIVDEHSGTDTTFS